MHGYIVIFLMIGQPQPFTNEQKQKFPSIAARYGIEIKPS
jgi:hypothetical protein